MKLPGLQQISCEIMTVRISAKLGEMRQAAYTWLRGARTEMQVMCVFLHQNEEHFLH